MSDIKNLSESKEALDKRKKFWQNFRNAAAVAGIITPVIIVIAIGLIFFKPQPTRYVESEYSAMLRRAQQTDAQNIIEDFEKANDLWMREIHYFSTNTESGQTIKALAEATQGKIAILEDCSNSLLSAPNIMAYSRIGAYDVINFRITFPPATMEPTPLELASSIRTRIGSPNKNAISFWEDKLGKQDKTTVKILDVFRIPGDMYDEVSTLSAFKSIFKDDIPAIARYKGLTPLSGNQLIAYCKDGDTSKIYFLLLQPFEV